ncbi:MAG: DUF4342 domain-containing protein [Chloroflexota bacterium]|jgi:hypothetical protein
MMNEEQTVNGNAQDQEPENGRIHVDEEAAHQSDQASWTEEFVVAGEELVDAVKKLVHETNIRRVVVKNEQRRIHLEVPLLLGVAGIALLPVYSALALIAALVADCTILVERIAEKPVEKAA